VRFLPPEKGNEDIFQVQGFDRDALWRVSAKSLNCGLMLVRNDYL
jgi:hypothetical protein